MSTDHDTGLDAAMDERLVRAGGRWRAGNGAVAEVDFAALSAPADEPFDVLITPASDTPPPRRRRTRLWLASAVGVAAAVAASVLVVQLGGTSGNGAPRPAIGSSGTQLVGTDWTLTGIEFGPQLIRPSGAAALRIDGSQLSGSDGCNHFGGTVSVSATTLAIGDLATTAIGCLDPSVGQTSKAVHAIMDGAVGWSITGDTLTITKAHAGSLTYQAARHTTTTDPKALVGTTWQLDSLVQGGTTSSYSWAKSAPALRFVDDHTMTIDLGCSVLTTAHLTMSAGALDFQPYRWTQPAACVGIQQLPGILSGAVTWSILDSRLTITKSGVGALVYLQSYVDAGILVSPVSPSGVPSATSTK